MGTSILFRAEAAAALGTLRRIGMVRVLYRVPGRERDLAVAAVVAGVIDPASKLATARALDPETASTSLGAVLVRRRRGIKLRELRTSRNETHAARCVSRAA